MQYLQEQRKTVLNQIKNTFVKLQKNINANPETAMGLDEQKLISQICMEYGNRKEKAKEYLRELIDAGFIERDSYGLWPGKLIKEGYQQSLSEIEEEMNGETKL